MGFWGGLSPPQAPAPVESSRSVKGNSMNILIMVIFFVLSAFTLAAGIMVVTVKNIIHAALWLIASFFTVAAMYLLLEAEFIAIVQVLIYVGAISILIL